MTYVHKLAYTGMVMFATGTAFVFISASFYTYSQTLLDRGYRLCFGVAGACFFAAIMLQIWG